MKGINYEIDKWLAIICDIEYKRTRINEFIRFFNFVKNYRKIMNSTMSFSELVKNLTILAWGFSKFPTEAKLWKK